ncbi:MAG: hypothetical protein ACE5KV_08295 [Thermoplasmata archaeon]
MRGNFMDMHSHAKTWAERAGPDIGLPMEERIREMIRRSVT